jgi:hypothetical protein
MPQGKAKSSFPHEPQRPRLPSVHRFGMLGPGVKVVEAAVTMRLMPPAGGDTALHAPFHELRIRQLGILGLTAMGSGSARVHPRWSISG